MRIISGKYKGRIIKMPHGIRPTQNKVRKALFDTLGDIKGLSFLELFAGSGAIGIEALSHNAKKAVFVENDRNCLKRIKESLSAIGALDYGIVALSAQEALKRLGKEKERFNIIFMDPPYYAEMAKKTLQTLGGYDILAPNGFVIVQHFKRDNLPVNMGDLTLFKESRYGDTILSFYKKAQPVGTVPDRAMAKQR